MPEIEPTDLKFLLFGREHFDEYSTWFRNENIKKGLYDIDEDWLDFVLNDKTGIEYAVILKGDLVAVVGLDLPSKTNPSFAIKNIAINPSRFRMGIGSRVLSKLLKIHTLKENEYWISFVESFNVSAQKFFEKNGWSRIENNETKDGMIKYEMKSVEN